MPSNSLTWLPITSQTIDDEIAIAAALNATLALHPESVVYGTQTCRVIMVSQSGRLRNSNYTKRLPLTVDIAIKIGKYMGAADGRWKNQYAFDENGNNDITEMYDVSDPWVNDSIKDLKWGLNLISAEYRNTSTLFYPAFQTAYDDDSSILNSIFTIVAGTQLEKIAHYAWTRLVGNSRLSTPVFLDRSEQYIVTKAEGLFDSRFRLECDSYQTEPDKSNGFSWTTNITLYGNVMRTVNTVSIRGGQKK